jgi:hypothetical protein
MIEGNAFFGHHPTLVHAPKKAAVVRGPLMFGWR